jgi:hypothetical protein
MENGEWRVQKQLAHQARNSRGGARGGTRKFLLGGVTWRPAELLYSWRSILHSPLSILYGNSLSSQLQSRSGVENSDRRMENFRMEIYSLLRHEWTFVGTQPPLHVQTSPEPPCRRKA